jgi:hypothetical protein
MPGRRPSHRSEIAEGGYSRPTLNPERRLDPKLKVTVRKRKKKTPRVVGQFAPENEGKVVLLVEKEKELKFRSGA